MKFDLDKILPGDILCVRSTTSFGKLIRATLGCYTNHNGMFVKKNGVWMIGEAISPNSTLTDPRDYEWLATEGGFVLRVLRIPESKITMEEREAMAQYLVDHKLGIPYPLSVIRLWIFRIVNSLPWKIHGEWCTKIVWESCEAIAPGILDRPDGKRKLNPTPRTIENRLVAGVLEDVTRQVLTT